MSKFSKPFTGVKAGEIYPTKFSVGDDCPSELESAARTLGALETQAPPLSPAQQFVGQNAADVIAALGDQTDVAFLTEVLEAEKEGQGRKTVVPAIEAAIEKAKA